MEVELQKQDFRAIENMETNLRLQKNEVCVHCHNKLMIHHFWCKADSNNDMIAGKSITVASFCYSYVWSCMVKLLQHLSVIHKL